ncbi:MAG: magnesium/cobalt transporter CorA [Pirellulales bacterium]|nr:magnesium/cobalt transporter CorA [Pirellulales bacterium]
MFRVLEVGPQGPVKTQQGEDNVAPPPEGIKRWVDLAAQDTAQLALLAERFSLHPLTIEDCAHFDQRPKLETYGDYLFLVIHGFRLPSQESEDVESQELHLFLGERFLITVHAEPIPGLEAVWQRLEGEGAVLRRGPDFVAYLIADAIVDSFFPLLDEIAAQVDSIEDRVLSNRTAVELAEIFHYKRLLVRLRKVLSPQRDVFALLAKRGEGWVEERTAVYFRDVYDHVLRLHESLEATRDLLSNALDAYLWSASERTNEIMKRLTILSAIFLPLTFITGFFGQNFEQFPFHDERMMVAMLVSCVAVPAGMVYYFIRSKWF